MWEKVCSGRGPGFGGKVDHQTDRQRHGAEARSLPPHYALWAAGDSGTGSSRQKEVLQAYMQQSGEPVNTDVMLVLGDNA
jgi:hypothetical protein